MGNISTTFCGKKVKSPLGVACLASYGGIVTANPRVRADLLLKAAEEGAGWISLAYTCTEDQKDYPKGKEPLILWGMIDDGSIEAFGSQKFITATGDEKSIMARRDEALEQVAILKRELPKDVLIKADCIAEGEDFDKWVSHGKEFEQAGADYIEFDVSCTVTAFHIKTEWAVSQEPGLPTEYLSHIPQGLAEIITKAKKEIKIPIGFKMAVEAGYPRVIHVANATKKAGADFITCFNAPIAFSPIDIYNDGKPLRSMWPHKANCFTFSSGMGRARARGLMAAIKMFVPDIELVGISGLLQPEHIVDYIMMGAQVCESSSGYLYHGVQFFRKCNKWLSRYMDQMGYESIDEFRGAALNHFKIGEDIDYEYGKYYAVTDTAKCNSCQNCVSLCDAPYVRGSKVLINPDRCAGCALCTFICPQGARILVAREVVKKLDIAKDYADQPWRAK